MKLAKPDTAKLNQALVEVQCESVPLLSTGMKSPVAKCMHSRQQGSLVRLRSGFSMVELMVGLAICAILLSIGVPSCYQLIQHIRLTTTVNAFFGAIHLTRSEAIRRSARVDLVPINGTDWAQGWIVFIDDDDNQIADPGERIVATHGPVSGKMVIRSVLTDSSKPYLAYNGAGRTRINASNQVPQFGTVSFILGEKARYIKLNFSGRPRTCDPESDKTCSSTGDIL